MADQAAAAAAVAQAEAIAAALLGNPAFKSLIADTVNDAVNQRADADKAANPDPAPAQGRSGAAKVSGGVPWCGTPPEIRQGQGIINHLTRVEETARFNRLPNYIQLSSSLGGDAANVLTQWMRTERIERGDPDWGLINDHWEPIKQYLTAYYSDSVRDTKIDARDRLMTRAYYQGKRPVREYVLSFKDLAGQAVNMNSEEKISWFKAGLSPALKTECATMADGGDWVDFDALVQYAYGMERKLSTAGQTNKVEVSYAQTRPQHVRQRVHNRSAFAPSKGKETPGTPVGSKRRPPDLTDEEKATIQERNERMRRGLCKWCGGPRHKDDRCGAGPKPPPTPTCKPDGYGGGPSKDGSGGGGFGGGGYGPHPGRGYFNPGFNPSFNQGYNPGYNQGYSGRGRGRGGY